MPYRTMTWIIAAVFVLGCLVATYIGVKATDRDSRSYRLVALAFGWAMPEPAQAEAIELPFADGFAQGLRSPQWTMYRPELLQELSQDQVTPGTWVTDAAGESVWWQNSRGPMAYVAVTGDVEFTTSVTSRKSSDPSAWPDSEWQFGGIILRDPAGNRALSFENYVFVVVGHRGKRLQVEYKNTGDGRSEVFALDWPSGDADLRIVRDGIHFDLYARPYQSAAPWQHLARWARPDLPQQLQAGMIQYAFSEGRNSYDLRVGFSNLEINQ